MLVLPTKDTGFKVSSPISLNYFTGLKASALTVGGATTSEEIGVQVQEQEKKTDQSSRDLETLEKDVAIEKDRVTTKLLTLSSRENRYATSITEMLRKQRHFYREALSMADAQLEVMEKTLNRTPYRSVMSLF